MAESLTREGPVDVLESAVQVLRRAGANALVVHWTGSIPFALGALFFWAQVSSPRTSDAACAIDALALALLLVWMNCRRAVFSGRIRRQLNGDGAATPRTRPQLFRLIAIQSLASGTKLLVLPLAALIVFPLPGVIAFYRNLAVLADRQDRSPRETLARARQLAGAQPELSWLTIPLLLLLGLMVMLNLTALIGGLPQLVRILTGYESAFSRSGVMFLMNSTFAALVLAATWVLFDPFVQTVYCLRCYQAESRETGEDIRAGIRRLRDDLRVAAASLLVAVAVAAAPVRCRADVPPETLQKAAESAAHAAEYDWRLPPPPNMVRDTPWIVVVTDRILASFQRFTDAAGRLLERFFSWIFDRQGDAARPAGGAPPVHGLHLAVYVLIAVVALGGIWLALRTLRLRRAKTEEAVAGEGVASVRLDAEDLTADRLPEERWLELAERALLEQNPRLALRALYLASLAWLGRVELIRIHPGKTNREYERELGRRLRENREARELFGANVAVFERAWYGLHAVDAEDVGEFRRRAVEMKVAANIAEGVAR